MRPVLVAFVVTFSLAGCDVMANVIASMPDIMTTLDGDMTSIENLPPAYSPADDGGKTTIQQILLGKAR